MFYHLFFSSYRTFGNHISDSTFIFCNWPLRLNSSSNWIQGFGTMTTVVFPAHVNIHSAVSSRWKSYSFPNPIQFCFPHVFHLIFLEFYGIYRLWFSSFGFDLWTSALSTPSMLPSVASHYLANITIFFFNVQPSCLNCSGSLCSFETSRFGSKKNHGPFLAAIGVLCNPNFNLHESVLRVTQLAFSGVIQWSFWTLSAILGFSSSSNLSKYFLSTSLFLTVRHFGTLVFSLRCRPTDSISWIFYLTCLSWTSGTNLVLVAAHKAAQPSGMK